MRVEMMQLEKTCITQIDLEKNQGIKIILIK